MPCQVNNGKSGGEARHGTLGPRQLRQYATEGDEGVRAGSASILLWAING